jgi:hypothetical protein
MCTIHVFASSPKLETMERAQQSQDPGLADVIDLVAAWLPDKTPLAVTARFARCAAHFRSYLAASAAATSFCCFSCGCDSRCVVRRHHHVAPGFIVYEGEVCDEGEVRDASYVWFPEIDCVACRRCSEGLGFDPFAWRRIEWRRSFSQLEVEEIVDTMLDMFLDSEA